jgi:hypothetical protein
MDGCINSGGGLGVPGGRGRGRPRFDPYGPGGGIGGEYVTLLSHHHRLSIMVGCCFFSRM